MTMEDTVSNVRVTKETLADFQIKEQLRQGDPRSTLLFNIVLEKRLLGTPW